MARGQGWKILLIIVLLVGSAYYLYPSVQLWTMTPEELAKLEETDPRESAALRKKAIKLGLDLKGGMHVVLLVDKSKLNEDEAGDAVERTIEILRNRVDQFGVAEPIITKQDADRIVVELPGVTDVERAQDLIGRTALLEFRLNADGAIAGDVLDRIDIALERVLGTATGDSATTAESGDIFTDTDIFGDKTDSAAANDSTSDLTGATDTAGDTDGTTAEPFPNVPTERPFSSLLDPSGDAQSMFLVAQSEVPIIKRYMGYEEVQRAIPDDLTLLWGIRPQSKGSLEYSELYLVRRNVELTGKYLTDAKPSFDQFRAPIVSFELTREGGRKFARLTGANIGKNLAIVLDGRVESAPVIKARIQNQGRITLGSGADYEEAVDMAIILRAGALPTDVKIVATNVVGPSLGADSIQKGYTASLIGLLLVALFMAIYYQLSGVIADFALAINVFFLLGVLAVLHATLTMPGIAGIILTVGISVDANVLIFERIREELRTGKTARAAITAGYKRALVAIVDSHVTTLITALALFLFGTGPVKGFAVTLAWGVAISLFTAYVITKVVFDIRKQYKTLSI